MCSHETRKGKEQDSKAGAVLAGLSKEATDRTWLPDDNKTTRCGIDPAFSKSTRVKADMVKQRIAPEALD